MTQRGHGHVVPGVAVTLLPVLPPDRSILVPMVHSADLADAIGGVLQREATGAFNLCASPPLTVDHIAAALGAQHVHAPGRLLRAAVSASWQLHLHPHRGVTPGFAEGMAWLAQIGLFVLLGLLASPSRLPDALLPALVVGSGLLLVGRPLGVIACATPFRVPWREQVFMSWAGLRGAAPIVLATIPLSQGLPDASRVFDVIFVLVVVFTLVQAPVLPWLARRLGLTNPLDTRAIQIESSPLEDFGSTLLQLTVPPDSRLAGVTVSELRLPTGAGVTLLLRNDETLVPLPTTSFAVGDHLLVVTPTEVQAAAERRLG